MQPARFLPWLEHWENKITHMYLDNAKKDATPTPNVTIGIGCLLPDLAAAKALPFWYSDKLGVPPCKATVEEIEWDWKRVKALPPGNRASYYQAHGTLVFLDDAAIDELAMARLTHDCLPGCHRLIAGFDYLPASVQQGVVDMGWNMGIGKLGAFHKFLAAVNARDWATAALECHRIDCREERNDWCAELFREAAGAPVA